MNQRQRAISAEEFIARLKESREAFIKEPIFVKDNVLITPDCVRSTSLEFGNIIFSGGVAIENFRDPSTVISFNSTSFLGQLRINKCQGISANLRSCEANWLKFNESRFDHVTIENVKCANSIELHGLLLNSHLTLRNTSFSELELHDYHLNFISNIGMAITDNPVAALQCRMAGFRVSLSTEAARKMLEEGADQALASV